MDFNKFQELCKEEVVNYHNEHSDFDKISKKEVYVVWYCKTLQNAKVLLSTTLSDGMYYEVTYSGDKNELYFDSYKKTDNKRIELEEK